MNPCIQKALDVLSVRLSENDRALSQDILTRAFIPILNRFQQKVNVGIQDSVTDILTAFRNRLQDEVFGVAQSYEASQKQQKLLLPMNCRFARTKGESDIFVIEQTPMRRTLTFKLDQNVLRTNLQLPYCLFLFHFKKGRLAEVYHYWRTQPLTSLNDKLHHPLLPNIHKSHSICFGNVVTSGDTVSEVIETTISGFWGSAFNNDLPQHFHRIKDVPKLSTLENWSQRSSDPFLFGEIDLPTDHTTLDKAIDTCLQYQPDFDAQALRRKLDEAIEQCSGQMFDRLMKYFKEKRFDKFYPQDIEQNVRRSVAEILDEIKAIVDSMRTETTMTGYGWKPVSKTWENGNGVVRQEKSQG